jgi:hypothetical protein
MSLHNYLKGHASTPISPINDTSWSGVNPGPFVGIVKGNKDPARMGRLQVLIPSMAKTLDPNEEQLISCSYLSPFYGAKGDKYVNGASREYEDSQHSYGFWGVPPDLETSVLVIFAEGKMSQAFWIGCIQDPYTNHMVPGIASSENTFDKTSGLDTSNPNEMKNAGVDKEKTYGTKNVPAGELNRRTPGVLQNGNYEATPKPIHPFADVLLRQGLSYDDVRGNTSSSARRESPSQVFGISTPGRKNLGSTKQKVGAKDSTATDHVARLSGHTFVMDDGAEDGTNQLTRLRTASGHQLLMHDTEGVVYLANGSGQAWLEMSSDGKIYVYSADGINIRTDGNFDLHSGADINFHATNHIKFTAENNISLNSENYVQVIGEQGVLTSSQTGPVKTYGKKGITSYSGGQQLHGSAGDFHLAGAAVHFNSIGASTGWGPTWLKPSATGVYIATDTSQNDVNITIEGGLLKANSKKTKTTVPNIVTHEPFTRAPSYIIETVSQYEDPEKWLKLSKTPGTLEYMAAQNRNSEFLSVKQGQLKADLRRFLDYKGAKSTNIKKATELSKQFTEKYNAVYKVKTVVDNLSTDNIKEILISKVTAGRITGVTSVEGAKSMAKSTIVSVATSHITGAIGSWFSTFW